MGVTSQPHHASAAATGALGPLNRSRARGLRLPPCWSPCGFSLPGWGHAWADVSQRPMAWSCWDAGCLPPQTLPLFMTRPHLWANLQLVAAQLSRW